jgi:cytochrome c553
MLRRISQFLPLLTLAFAASTVRAADHSNGEPPAVIVRVCSGCHGINGQSPLPYVPRLAGLSAKYQQQRFRLYRQAPPQRSDEAIIRLIHWRTTATRDLTAAAAAEMVGIAKRVSEVDVEAATAWYAAQPARTPEDEEPSGNADGRTLFAAGLPKSGVPACSGCHGAQGQGTPVAPRISGQHAEYVVARLRRFRNSGPATSPMTNIARALTQNQARAVARFLDGR